MMSRTIIRTDSAPHAVGTYSQGTAIDNMIFTLSLKLTVFLTDLSRFAELNEVFLEFFTEDPPARSALEVSKLPLGADVEIECIALKEAE